MDTNIIAEDESMVIVMMSVKIDYYDFTTNTHTLYSYNDGL